MKLINRGLGVRGIFKMKHKKIHTKYPLALATILALVGLIAFSTSCGIYSFNESKPIIADSIRTFKIDIIENRAPYTTPQLSPNLTQRVRQKITNQTKLTETKNNNAHLYITGRITDYSVSTTGVSTNNQSGRQQASINRLTVTVQITMTNQAAGTSSEHTVSRSFDFSANQSLQAAEAALLDEMVRNLSDEIFNQLFSGW